MTSSKDSPDDSKASQEPEDVQIKRNEKLDRGPSAGALRARNGLSSSEQDLWEAAEYTANKERESSADSD